MNIDLNNPKSIEKNFTVAASPCWIGVETDQRLIDQNNQTILLETLTEDMQEFFDFQNFSEITKTCGDFSIGLHVLDVHTETKTIAYEYLDSSWRIAGLHDLANEQVRKNIIQQKKMLQHKLTLTHVDRSFDLIQRLILSIQTHPILCPKPILKWQSFFQKARQVLEQRDYQMLPCHLNGNISDVWINDQNDIMLSHFGFSALADPLHDVGCYLMESYELKEDAQQGYMEWFGEFNLQKFEWAWLYGMLDDLKWGLIAIHLSAHSKRTQLEFGKYASWRFLRFEENLKITNIDE